MVDRNGSPELDPVRERGIAYPRDCEHGHQYRKRIGLCAACTEAELLRVETELLRVEAERAELAAQLSEAEGDAMTEPRPLSKCQRCGDSYCDHRFHADGSIFCQVSGYTSNWLPRKKKASKRRSLSFNPAEVDALSDLLAAVIKHDTRSAIAIAQVRNEPVSRVLGRLKGTR